MRAKRYLYVLSGLMHPTTFNEVKKEVELTGDNKEILLTQSKINLRGVFVLQKGWETAACLNFSKNPRYLMRISDGKKDDELAHRFVNAAMLALALVRDVVMGESPLAIAVEESEYSNDTIRIESLLGSDVIGSEQYFALSEGVGFSADILEHVWRIAPVIAENPDLKEATSFYAESIKNVYIADVDIGDILLDRRDTPSSPFDKASIETAYQNAFKAIEAIIGEPPKDIRKLKRKLIQAGVNPEEIVGWDTVPGKDTLTNKIVTMRNNRDKQVAHGKTKPRSISYTELKDKQELSRYIILSNIECRLSGR